MSYSLIQDFKTGIDRRRAMVAARPGSLWDLVNAHITRDGDIEKRKAFVAAYNLPANTFGMASASDTLYVFGSAAAPTMPAGVTYQRLQHPDGLSMTAVLDAVAFDGQVFAVAEYSDGSKHYFYNGTIVSDWDNGVVRSAMVNNAGIASHLVGLISSDSAYTVTSLSNVITIEAANAGTPFSISAEVDGNGTVALAQTQANVAFVAETLATGSIRFIWGTNSPGVNVISAIRVNGVDILGASVNCNDSLTVSALANQINGYTSSPNYTASAFGDVLTITAAAGTGATPNGYAVQVVSDGDVLFTTGGFRVTDGSSGSSNKISSIVVNGLEILGTDVMWTTSNTITAAAIASQINTHQAIYNAASAGDMVLISPATATSSTSGFIPAITVGGNVTIGGVTTISTTVVDMHGGVTSIASVKQRYTATIGGTFTVGDRFTIIIDDKKFGAKGNPRSKGSVVFTHGGKVYALCGSLAQFSGFNAPIDWNADDDVGAGWVNLANHDSGSAALTGIEGYQGNVAIFSRNNIQIWDMQEDDTQNLKIQTLKNIGTKAAKSILAFGDGDVIFYSDSGIRSLRARDASNAAFVNDIGTAIDPYVFDHSLSLSESEISSAVAINDPVDGRYMLALGPKVFVLSYFPVSRVTGWSVYEPGFEISDFAIVASRVYARSGDVIYLYGGADNNAYDDCLVTVQLGFIDGGKPGHAKNIKGIDIAALNSWDVEILVNPNDTNQRIIIGELSGTTYHEPNTGAVGYCHHFAPLLTCSADGPATISNLSVYFTMADDE